MDRQGELCSRAYGAFNYKKIVSKANLPMAHLITKK
jgi:hypothetical protein